MMVDNNNSKIVWVSVIGNIILVVALVLSIAFGRTKPIEKYEAEIATLTTLNVGLAEDVKQLTLVNNNSKMRFSQLDKEYKLNLADLIESDKIIERLKTKRQTNGKSDYVDSLSDDAIIGEFTGYFERRAKRNR